MFFNFPFHEEHAAPWKNSVNYEFVSLAKKEKIALKKTENSVSQFSIFHSPPWKADMISAARAFNDFLFL